MRVCREALGIWAQLAATGVGSGIGSQAHASSVSLPAGVAGEAPIPDASVSGSGGLTVAPGADPALGLGLLHLAATAGHSESMYVLGQRYTDGTRGVPRVLQLGALLLRVAADVAYANYNRLGNQVGCRPRAVDGLDLG